MSLDALRGRVAFVFEEADFDVDQIVGVENIRLTDPDALAACAMRRFDPGFAEQVRPGDVVVGAENFGYGHPHFAPMIGLRRLGIRAVIAESFATGYWREEIAEGFPPPRSRAPASPASPGAGTRSRSTGRQRRSATGAGAERSPSPPIPVPSAACCRPAA